MIEKAVNLYIGADHAPVVVNVAQYDSQWEYHFRVYYEDQEWEIPEGCTATLVGKKKDGHVALYATSIVDNEIVVNPNFQLTACPGDVKAEVRIIAQNGQSVATPRLVFRVAASPEGDEDVASGTTLTAYQEIFAEASELMEAASNITGMTGSGSVVDTIEEADAVVTGGTGGQPYNIHVYIPKGERGPVGVTDLRSSVTTLSPGSNATANITKVSDGVYNIAFGIPRGVDGSGAVSTVMGESPNVQTHDVEKWALMQHIYPVGAIYISTVSTAPNILFGGGTWERIEANRFLLSAGTGEYAPGEKGGADKTSLEISNLPAHTHGLTKIGRTSQKQGTGTTYYGYLNTQWNEGGAVPQLTDSTGDGEEFSIMPPYLAVYMWERTA